MTIYSAKDYAQALYEELDDAPIKKHLQIVHEFADMIRQHRQTKLLSQIIQDFETFASTKEKCLTIRMVSALPLNNLDYVSHALTKNLKQDIEIYNFVKPEIIGGLEIWIGDYKIDLSLKSKLKPYIRSDYSSTPAKINQAISLISEHIDLLFSDSDVQPKTGQQFPKIIHVFSARPKSCLSYWEKLFSARLHQKVIIHHHLDQNMSSGIIIKYDNKKIDASINKKFSK